LNTYQKIATVLKAEESHYEYSQYDAVEIPTKVVDEDGTVYDVKHIGDYAFAGMTAKCVKLHGGIETIGDYAFAACQYLSHVDGCEHVKHIGTGAFIGCRWVNYINLVAVETIEDLAFFGCHLFCHIRSYYDQTSNKPCLYGVQKIGYRAFYNTGFESIVFVDSQPVPRSAFGGSTAKSVRVKNGDFQDVIITEQK
jgi:hypothetical protein